LKDIQSPGTAAFFSAEHFQLFFLQIRFKNISGMIDSRLQIMGLHMELQLAGSRCEQIMVLRLISHRFSKISKRIFTSRSSVMVCNRKSSRMSRAAPQILFRRFWYFE